MKKRRSRRRRSRRRRSRRRRSRRRRSRRRRSRKRKLRGRGHDHRPKFSAPCAKEKKTIKDLEERIKELEEAPRTPPSRPRKWFGTPGAIGDPMLSQSQAETQGTFGSPIHGGQTKIAKKTQTTRRIMS